MLPDVCLTASQLRLLRHAAERAGQGNSPLHEAWAGSMARISDRGTCVGFTGGFEDRQVFYAVVDAHDPQLAGILRARQVYDGDHHCQVAPVTFYWPGVLVPAEEGT